MAGDLFHAIVEVDTLQMDAGGEGVAFQVGGYRVAVGLDVDQAFLVHQHTVEEAVIRGRRRQQAKVGTFFRQNAGQESASVASLLRTSLTLCNHSSVLLLPDPGRRRSDVPARKLPLTNLTRFSTAAFLVGGARVHTGRDESQTQLQTSETPDARWAGCGHLDPG